MTTSTLSPQRTPGPAPRAGASVPGSIAMVLAADERFGMPLGVTLHSALTNLRVGVHAEVFVLDGGLSSDTRDRLCRVVARHDATLQFISPDLDRYRTPRLGTQERFSPINFARIHLDAYLLSRLDRVLYLDCDLVVERDLSTLWEVEFGDTLLLAVQDQAIPRVSSSLGIQRWCALGLSPEMPFFNSGMMVINLPRYRRESIGRQVFNYLLQYREQLNLFGNQEGFNAVLAGRWTPLDGRWNVVHAAYDPAWRRRTAEREGYRIPHEVLTRAPYIIHFTDDTNPWDPRSQHPARNRFYRALRNSRYLSPTEYLRWRTSQDTRRAYHWLRRTSRPLRHRIGLRKSLVGSSQFSTL